MSTMAKTARSFFTACEEGKGWDECRAYCTADATFASQAEPLADVKAVQQYTEWMKGLSTVLTDGRYEVKSFATDAEHKDVCAYAVFTGTHIASSAPIGPTHMRNPPDVDLAG